MARANPGVPRLLYTDKRCVINGRNETGLPVLLDSQNKIVWSVLDWFCYLRTKLNRPATSIRTMADHIRQFWEFIENARVDWQDVDDDLLELYRNMQQLGQRVSRDQKSQRGANNVARLENSTINYRLMTIFNYYDWCHLQGLISSEVFGVTDGFNNQNPIPPQITAKARYVKGKDGRQTICWSSPLLYKNVNKKFFPIPTNDEMTKFHAKLTEKHTPDVGWRNILMSSIQEDAGLRREELQRLKVDQIPDDDVIDGLFDNGELFAIDVIGKGSKLRTVCLTSDLIREIREYIDDARAKLIDRIKQPSARRKKRGVYREPEEIFLGHTSGQPLSKDAIGKCLSAGLKEAGVKARPHRIRAKFLNDMVHAKSFALWDEKGMKHVKDSDILSEVAELAGHSHVKSLEHYVKLAKKAYIKMSKAERIIYMEKRKQSVERILGATHARLKGNKELLDVAKAIEGGDKEMAKFLLSELLNKIDGVEGA